MSQSDDPVVWREYLRCFPDGSLATEAQTIVTAAEQRERAREAADELAARIEREEALRRRDATADDQSWKDAVSRGTEIAVQGYLDRYPSGRHVAEATGQLAALIGRQREESRRREDALAWEGVERTANQEAFEAYLVAYPDGAFVEQATKKILDLELEAASRTPTDRELHSPRPGEPDAAKDKATIDDAQRQETERRRAEATKRAEEARLAALERAKEVEKAEAERRQEEERKAEALRSAALARAEAEERANALLATELAEWNRTKDSDDPRDFREYLARFPGGRFEALALEAANALERVADAKRRARSATQNELHRGGR